MGFERSHQVDFLHSKVIIRSMIYSILKKDDKNTLIFDLDEIKKNPEDKIENSLIQVSKDSPKSIVFYNPLSSERKEVVRLRVSTNSLRVTDASGNEVDMQTSPGTCSHSIHSHISF